MGAGSREAKEQEARAEEERTEEERAAWAAEAATDAAELAHISKLAAE